MRYRIVLTLQHEATKEPVNKVFALNNSRLLKSSSRLLLNNAITHPLNSFRKMWIHRVFEFFARNVEGGLEMDANCATDFTVKCNLYLLFYIYFCFENNL